MQQNENSGTRIANQTVDTTANEGSKTMGRGFLNRATPPSIFLGGIRGSRRQGFVFPSFPHGVDNMQLSSSREAVGSLLRLAVKPVTPEGPYG